MSSIPGYTHGTRAVAKSPVSLTDFQEMAASVLFGDEDVKYLRLSHDVVKGEVEAILDVWYSFVGSQPQLLASFTGKADGKPLGDYLNAVRKRFGQWILDTCRAEYDSAWLAWQDEIGRRHHRSGKNTTEGVTAAAHIPMRHLLALVIPISITMRPFLAKNGASAAEVDKMHGAWTKAVLLQAILWSRP